MTTPSFNGTLDRDEYNFLREDARLGKNIAYLTIAGSFAYGTNNDNSDLDFAMANEYESQLLSAYKHSKLPDNPDVAKIDKLLLEIYHEQMRLGG